MNSSVIDSYQPIYLKRDLSLYVVVDSIDYEWACLLLWNAKPRPSLAGDHWYAKRNVTAARTPVYLHRLICERAHGPAPRRRPISDHISGNTLDCRRANLRWASYAQNARNCGGRSFVVPLQPRLLMDFPGW